MIGMSSTHEIFVIDKPTGPRTYTDVLDLASAIVSGVGFSLSTTSFNATVLVLTDGTRPPVDLTDLVCTAALDTHRAKLAAGVQPTGQAIPGRRDA